MARAFIGIGTNLGDRQAHLDRARAALAAMRDSRLVAFSKIYETAPVGPIEQPAFLNAAAELDTALDPFALRRELVAIEEAQGREPLDRRQRWGPRTLDLDLLLYDDRVIESPELTVPHPRMHERRFALQPLCDLAPDLIHPTRGQPLRALLEALATDKHR